MKITIRNSTVWPTRMLRPFVVRTARDEFDGSTPRRQPRSLTVEIGYAEGHSDCSGEAYLRTGWSRVRVPNPTTIYDEETHKLRRRRQTDPPARFPVHDFVHVLAHEFAHNIGLKHADMNIRYQNRSKAVVEQQFPWVTTLARPVLPEKKVVPLDVKRAQKLATIATAVARWERKSKLAGTKLKYWRRRLRAYERLVAVAPAAAQTKPQEEIK